MADKITQTAGRDQLGEIAPLFAHLNDDVLFGEVWNEPALDMKTKCVVTVVALIASGVTDSSLAYHLRNAKKHGVSKEEIAAIITHTTMYAGWPKGWAALNLAKEVWVDGSEGGSLTASDKDAYARSIVFPIGKPNPYGDYFVGQSYLAPVVEGQLPVFNVTFEPGCRNNWHIHHADEGGGQALICVGGRGFYQEWGHEPVELAPGDAVSIPAGVKHWHGAAPDSWFSHLALEIPGANAHTEWIEPVSDTEYAKLRER